MQSASAARVRPVDHSPLVLPSARTRAPVRAHRAAALLNLNAKRVDRRTVKAFSGLLPEGDLFLSSTAEEGLRHVRAILEGGYSTVMLGGGDGTIAAAMEAFVKLGSELRFRNRLLPDLAILKLGTGNALAAGVGADRPVEDARKVLSGETAGASVLRVLEAEGLSDAFSFGSIGYDAQILNDYVDLVEQTPKLGRRFAKSMGGYALAIATRTIPAELRRPKVRMKVTALGRASILDPETAEEIPLDTGARLFDGEARAVLLGSSPCYGYGMRVLPYAQRRADRFHLRVSLASIPFVLANLPSIWKGTHRSDRFVDFLVEGARVECSQPMPLQLSGDAAGTTDALEVRLSERAFRLVHF